MEHTPHSEAQQQLRAQRRARNAQVVSLVLLAAGLGLLAGLGESPLCWINEVRVVGPDPALAQAVTNAIHVPAGASTIFFSLPSLERQATKLPQVQSAEVSRASFHCLVVHVTRRVPVAMVAHEQGLLLVGQDGVITNLVPPASKAPRLPQFIGLPVARPEPGGRLDAKSTELVAHGAHAAQDAGLTEGLRLDCTQPLNLRLSAGGVEGFLGATDNLERKISLFAQLLQDFRRKGFDPEYIDVRAMDQPVWKPKDSAAAPVPASNSAGSKPAAKTPPKADGAAKPAPPKPAGPKPVPAGAKPAKAGVHSGAHPPQKPAGDDAVD